MHMFAILLRLAWRNLWRNHRRTSIMLMAIVLGAWAMIFMTALMRGMVTDVVEDGISALPGHVQVHHPDFRDDPSIANLIPVRYADLTARFAGALTVADFCKDIHVVTLDQQAVDAVADAVAVIADAEGLAAHADSVRMRTSR